MGRNTTNEGGKTKLKEKRVATMDSKKQTCTVPSASAFSLQCCESGMNCS